MGHGNKLASIVKIFALTDSEWRTLVSDCEKIVQRAIALHEKFLTSTHIYHISNEGYVYVLDNGVKVHKRAFLHDLEKSKCENIMQNRKLFSLEKMNPRPTLQQLDQGGFELVLVTVPALLMRQVGKADVVRESKVVRKQQALVSWMVPAPKPEGNDSHGGRGEGGLSKPVPEHKRSLISQMFYPKQEKIWGGWGS